jgi:hypothetical protein
LEPETREAGEVLARFFAARLRRHSLSRFWISSCETDSNVRTTASNFSASDFVNVCLPMVTHKLIQFEGFSRFVIGSYPFQLLFFGMTYVSRPVSLHQGFELFAHRRPREIGVLFVLKV